MSADQPVVTLDGDTLLVSGAVDPLTVISVRQEGEKWIRASKADLQVDLSAMGTAHSVVLSLLLCWHRLAVARSQALRFTGVSERLNSLAALSGLDRHLPGFSAQSSSESLHHS